MFPRWTRPGLGFLWLLLAGCALPGGSTAPGTIPARELFGTGFEAPARVLLVSVAGLTAERVEPGAASAMPTLARMAAAGAYALDVEPVAPAQSRPAHATLVTGERPADHGVAADHLVGDHGVRRETYDHATHLRAQPLWQAARQRQRSVAAIGWPGTVGAAIDALVPELFPRRAGESADTLLRGAATAQVVPLAERSGVLAEAATWPGPDRDRALAALACELYAGPVAPDLTLLRLSQTDPVLRNHGPDSDAAAASFGRVDRELAALLQCLGRWGHLRQTAVIVVGDRGYVPVHTQIAANVVLGSAGLLRSAADGRLSDWSALVRSNGGTAFVYARDDRAAVEARRILETAARDTRAFRIVPAEEMLALGADPTAWFGLAARPGYVFANGAEGPVLRAAAGRAAAGYLPGTQDSAPAFVAFGAGIREGLLIPSMRQTDVAPTVGLLLRFDLGARDGRALVGILAGGGPVSAGAEDGQ